MTRVETIKIMTVLRAAYPQYYKNFSKDELEGVVALWNDMFSDDEYNIVAAAVKTFIASDKAGFPPVIGTIKEKIRQLTTRHEMTEFEAWNLVSKAIRNSGYHANEEFTKLPEHIKRMVGSPKQLEIWGDMYEDEVQTVVASNFMRSYRVKAQSRREMELIPESVKAMLTPLTDTLKLPDSLD